jgi:arylformamidase
MRIIDITWPLSPDMIVWPENTRPQQTWTWTFERGDTSSVSHWVLGSHTGTHTDAPCHILPGGAELEHVELSRMVGPARVLDLTAHNGHIDAGALAGVDLDGVERVLFRTTNSLSRLGTGEFDTTFQALEADGAQLLVDAGVRGVGWDYLSIEKYMASYRGATYPTHETLLGAGVAIMEGLDLSKVEAGDYFLCFLPLRLQHSEASPCRAVLIEGVGAL